jgi:hypothetical protein
VDARTGEGAHGGTITFLRSPRVATIAATLFGCDDERGRKRKEKNRKGRSRPAQARQRHPSSVTTVT